MLLNQPLGFFRLTGWMPAAVLTAGLLLLSSLAGAETPEEVDAREGKEFASRLASGRPDRSFTNRAVLRVRDASGRREPVQLQIITRVESESDWSVRYEVLGGSKTESLRIRHRGSELPIYEAGTRDTAFAGSDFTGCDLALEFYHWPVQRMIRRPKPEMRKGRPCRILESVTSDPTSPYVRVRSWIDLEHLQPLIAEAYDARGNLVKEFSVGSVRKVEGNWELKDLEMVGEKSGSQTKLEFLFTSP
jgi:Outer membrane lipoprotein-sorting protein